MLVPFIGTGPVHGPMVLTDSDSNESDDEEDLKR